VEAYDEKKPNLWQRLTSNKDRYLHFLRLVSYEHARRGQSLILGRGGQVVFAELPGVLRVRVVAPFADRVARFARERGIEEQRARQAVQTADRDRAAFYQFLFRIDWSDPELYDIIVNTRTITPEQAAGLIKNAVKSAEFAKKEQAAGKLEQLYLAEKAAVTILYEENLAVQDLEVRFEGGYVILTGAAQDNSTIGRCMDAAAAVFGIKTDKVQNRISFLPGFAEHLAGVHTGKS
jgi:hypothetical protein